MGPDVEVDITRRRMMGRAAMIGLFAGFGLAPRDARAQVTAGPVLLMNLRLFDGRDLAMCEGALTLVDGGLFATLLAADERPEGAEVICCGTRAAILSLIDYH